jgi:hypothetical protein
MILYGTYKTYITVNDDVQTITPLAIKQANLIWANVVE